MRKRLLQLAAVAALAGAAAPAFPAGFHIREQGAKAMGMANAFVAQADDPSAVFYNPAGMAFLKGSQASLGVTAIQVPETEFRGTTWLGDRNLAESEYANVKQTARADLFTPPNLYATATLESVPLAFGFAVNSLYPLAKRWDATSPFADEVKELAIKPLNVSPNVAYRWKDLAVAVGLDYTKAILWLENSPYKTVNTSSGPVNLNVGDLEVEGEGDGWGYNFGLLWKPLTTVSAGLSYRSRIKIDVKDGNADLAVSQKAQDLGVFGGRSHINTDGATEITLPDTWSFALAWKPVAQLTLEADADRFGWSSYDKLTLEFDDPDLGEKTMEKKWNNTWTYRFGVQYAATQSLDLRVGYAYDNTPVPDSTLGPDLPDADRHNLTCGIGYHGERGAVDLAYMWVRFRDRSVSNEHQDGEFKNQAHLFAANVSYSF